jgi:hypothetical protein
VLCVAKRQLQKCAAQGHPGAWPVAVTCCSLTKACEVGHPNPDAPMLLVWCQGWGGDQPQAPTSAESGALLCFVPVSPSFNTVGGPCRQKKCFAVVGLVAKQMRVGGPCRQICSQTQLACRVMSPTIAKGPKHEKHWSQSVTHRHHHTCAQQGFLASFSLH